MSNTRARHIPEDACPHINTVDDGECVCTDCGLVLSQIYLPSVSHLPKFPQKSNDMREFIRDVGENACMPNNVLLYAENYYDKIKLNLVPSFDKKTVAAYALYESLNKFEVPRMAEEIQYYTGVEIKRIWQVETKLTLEQSMNEPRNYVHRYCTLLDFSYSEQLIVKETVEFVQRELAIGNFRSNCLVAVIIYLHCKESKKNITLKKICETCAISATSVHRVLRQLSELCPTINTTCLNWIVKHINRIV
jgi:transcription initiation factor TFIIIB Brf1 subunit/transcription initiation factor TFIIB